MLTISKETNQGWCWNLKHVATYCMLLSYIGIKKDRFNLKHMRDEIFAGDAFTWCPARNQRTTCGHSHIHSPCKKSLDSKYSCLSTEYIFYRYSCIQYEGLQYNILFKIISWIEGLSNCVFIHNKIRMNLTSTWKHFFPKLSMKIKKKMFYVKNPIWVWCIHSFGNYR